MASGRHHLGRKRTVQSWMPLPGDTRLPTGQVVKPGQHLAPCTIRAPAATRRSCRNCREIRMPQLAAPPNAAVAANGNLLREKAAVLLLIPLLCKRRACGCKIIHTRQDPLSGTDRTSAAIACPSRNRRLPFMPVFTYPPNLPAVPNHHLVRAQRPVFPGMPLSRKGWVRRRQIVHTGQ